jgi:hypothetical protein
MKEEIDDGTLSHPSVICGFLGQSYQFLLGEFVRFQVRGVVLHRKKNEKNISLQFLMRELPYECGFEAPTATTAATPINNSLNSNFSNTE